MDQISHLTADRIYHHRDDRHENNDNVVVLQEMNLQSCLFRHPIPADRSQTPDQTGQVILGSWTSGNAYVLRFQRACPILGQQQFCRLHG